MFKDFLNAKLTGETIDAKTGLKRMPKSQAHVSENGMVEFGYGQVEPNQLSAQRTGQIYAQLPADPEIEILEQGQFVKYDYAANGNGIGLVDFKGKGEWMLVFNEIKLYRNHIDGTKQWDCEFAMIKDDYQARIYSPYDYEHPEVEYHNALNLNNAGEGASDTFEVKRRIALDSDLKGATIAGVRYELEDDGKTLKYGDVTVTFGDDHMSTEEVAVKYAVDDVTLNTEDPYELNFTNDPWKKLGIYREKRMPAGTSMVPRVFKTNVGDIFTTNMVKAKFADVNVGDTLAPGADDGILAPASEGDMLWQIVKKYDLPDGQQAVKVMRIK